jgi:hypothetical protein
MAKMKFRRLLTLFGRLKQDRAMHLQALAEIDAVFGQAGMVAEPAQVYRSPGRPTKSFAASTVKKSGKQRKRRQFATTANEMILATIKKSGAKGATGAQLTSAWKAAGRPGDAYNSLSLLTKSKTIRRQNIPGERGSRYLLA